MSEIQAIDNVFQTIQTSIVLQAIFVTLVLAAVILLMLRREGKQDDRDSNVLQKLLEANADLRNNKEQLDRFGDGLDTAVTVLQNHQQTLNRLQELVKQSTAVLQAFSTEQTRMQKVNDTVAQGIIDVMVGQEEINKRLTKMDDNLDVTNSANMRLTVLLEQLIAELKTFNGHMEVIKNAVLHEITSEQPAVKPETLPEKETQPDEHPGTV